MKLDNDEQGLYVYVNYRDILILTILGIVGFMTNLIIYLILLLIF
jgi:hypothetical protein